VADVYEIARAGLELAEKANAVLAGPSMYHEGEMLIVPDPSRMFDANGRDGWMGESSCPEYGRLFAHAGTHYAALCRALLAQKAVVEAAVEQERQRFLADEARAARQDLETQAQHTEDYRSACRTTNAAVRAMKEQAR